MLSKIFTRKTYVMLGVMLMLMIGVTPTFAQSVEVDTTAFQDGIVTVINDLFAALPTWMETVGKILAIPAAIGIAMAIILGLYMLIRKSFNFSSFGG